MKPTFKDIGTKIAERFLEGREKDGSTCKIVVKLGKPIPDKKETECWYCPYSITKGTERRVFYGAGIDSLQALRIAIAMVDCDLKSRYRHLTLTWMDDSSLGLTDKF